MNITRKEIALLSVLIASGVVLRLIPHMANFVPITGLSLLAASYLSRKWALLVPLATMVLSDLIIGLHSVVLFTWGSYVLIALLGSLVYYRTGKRSSVALLGPVGAVLFFVISNFGVWLQGCLYAYSWAGFVRCYEMALPFFRATLVADTCITPLLFVAAHFLPKLLLAARIYQVQVLNRFFGFGHAKRMISLKS